MYKRFGIKCPTKRNHLSFESLTVKQCIMCLCTNYYDITNHGFSHMICAPETSTSQNIAKLLTLQKVTCKGYSPK